MANNKQPQKAKKPWKGQAMSILFPDGTYLCRYLIPKKTAGNTVTGIYSEGTADNFADAEAAAISGLPPPDRHKVK